MKPGAGPDRGRGAAPVRHPAARARLQADERGRVRLRAQPHPLRRLPQVRPRLRRREQPVAQSRRSNTSASSRCPTTAPSTWTRRPQLTRPEIVPEPGLLLHARAVPAVQEPALRQGLPGQGHLAGAGRHHRDRLQLVHRLPLLRGRVPLFARRFNFTAPDIPKERSTRTCPTWATGRGTRA
jgi:hypothetical protein